jgi:hypothetical protein
VDESLLADFVAESREHLDGIEPDLMALDQGGARPRRTLLIGYSVRYTALRAERGF